MNKILRLLHNYVEDFLIFTGLGLVTYATFLLSFVAGIYVTGAISVLLGLYFAKNPIKGR